MPLISMNVHEPRSARGRVMAAAGLGISVSTVKTHIGNVLRKTGQTNRVRLIVWVSRHLRGL